MRSILKLPTSEQLQSRANREFYVSEMASVFRKNLDLAHYTPLYDNYNEFLQLVLD